MTNESGQVGKRQRANGVHPLRRPAAYPATGLLLLSCLFAGCGMQPDSPPAGTLAARTPTSTKFVTSPPEKTPETATPTIVWWNNASADTGWETLRLGLERRKILFQDAAFQTLEELLILRVDPRYFSLNVGYDPQGKTLEEWQSGTGTAAVVNGGYFRRENELYLPDGLIIAGGKTIGLSYGSFAGMLAIGKTATELRWLADQPYDPREPLRAAIQSFPVLIKPDGRIGFPAENEDHIQARRTVVGQDHAGRILFLVASVGAFTLHQLSVYLHDSDLDLKIAMNLDGGPSSGVLIENPREIIPAQYALPIVITVQPE
jgi:hypothetical protein